MRVGPEQFIYRDFAFIDAMILPAVGPKTVAIYDVLRRYIWRASDKGAKRSRDAFKKGKLSATITRDRLAQMSGVSVRTVQRHLNRLRDIGWVQWMSGNGTGETVVYELGIRTPDGFEVFYADASARRLWLGLEELAVEQGAERVTDLPCNTRLTFAKAWFEPQEEEGEGGGDKNVTRVVTEVSPGVVTEMAPSNREPFGEEIEKSEYTGRCAPMCVPGPGPEHWDRPSGPERRTKDDIEEEEDELMAEFALDTQEGSGDDSDDDRFARAAKVAEGGKAKADRQTKANQKKRAKKKAVVDTEALVNGLIEGRTEKVKDNEKKDQKRRNLKGGTKYTYAVLKASREAWDVFTRLLKERDKTLPVARWNADGNAKARGQVCRLVDMYGGEATIETVRYVVGNWDSINERFFKKITGLPHFGMIAAMHEPLFREASVWSKHSEVLEEREAWFRDNPMKPMPRELKERYEVARRELSALGLG